MNKELYSIRVNWSDEDGGFIATVPEFPGLSAFGETKQEAMDEAQIAMEGFIEIIEEDGKKLPEPEKIAEYSGQTRLRIPKSLHKKIAQSAERDGVSMNQYLVSLISGRQAETETTQKLLNRMADTFYRKLFMDVKTAVFPNTLGEDKLTQKELKLVSPRSSEVTYKYDG